MFHFLRANPDVAISFVLLSAGAFVFTSICPQLDEQGRFKPELSYSYTFNLNEMKSPLVELVTRAGWTWRPTVWRGPIWLR